MRRATQPKDQVLSIPGCQLPLNRLVALVTIIRGVILAQRRGNRLAVVRQQPMRGGGSSDALSVSVFRAMERTEL